MAFFPWQAHMSLPNAYETSIILFAGGELAGFSINFDDYDTILFEDIEVSTPQPTPFDLADALKPVIEAANPDLVVVVVGGYGADAPATVKIRFRLDAPIRDRTPGVAETSGYLAAGSLQVTPPRRV